jgi:hypothetical protein
MIWEDNIKIDLKVISWEILDEFHLAQGRDQWLSAMNMAKQVQDSITVGDFLD